MKNQEQKTAGKMAISNCLFSPTCENPKDWGVKL